jgi:uncharacterized membrane-anchored protein
MDSSGNRLSTQLLNKVPEVTIFFWIIKVLATTVGETGADLLAVNLKLGLVGTSYVTGGLLALALFLQLRAQRYVPSLYWIAVVLTSVFGTLISDNLVDRLGVSLQTTTLLFGTALLGTFAAWYASERTLSIRSVDTLRRELFYWAAILFTFALGTAAGDLAAEAMKLGYGPSALVFAGMIAAAAAARYTVGLNSIAAFWIAYILTRPLGASFGDFLAQPIAHGGVGLGSAGTSAVFLTVILSLVVYLTISRRDTLVPVADRR